MTRYKAVLPEHNDNISDKNPLREFFTLTIGLFIVLFIIWLLLGFAINYAVQWISPQREYAIFSPLRSSMLKQEDNNNKAQQELQNLLDRLKPCAGIEIPLHIRLSEETQPNAMALPGGGVIVNSGLLAQIESENGLAFVLAHELGHFKNRDHLRGIGHSLVLVVLSSLFTGADSPLTRLVTPAINLGMAQYSQQQESRADSAALAILTCHYGHAGGATEFFETLGKHRDFNGMHWFASHPQTETRIEALQKSINTQSIPLQAVKPLPPSLQQRHTTPES